MQLVTIAPDGAWSLGVLIGVPILGLIVLAGLVFGIMVLTVGISDGEGETIFAGAAILVVVLVLVGICLSPLGYYPFDAEYHQWRKVSGVVEDSGSRLLPSSDGKATEQKIVVRFAGSDLDFGCQDTRCALIKKGDTLDLKCKRAWQYQSVSGYDCRFIGRIAGAR
jgi:hypothetical protein